jgi:pyruvate,water dikinase
MEKKMFVSWFEELCKDDAPVVGKKCANLGEMTRLGLDVPPGFALTLALYEKFLQDSDLGERLARYIGSLENLKGAGVERLREISSKLRGMIENEPMPKFAADLICQHYDELCERIGIRNVPVSVRSAGVESRPGMFETYLNIEGKEEVVAHVQKVWASSFTPRAIAFRANKGFPIDGDMLGVAIPMMVRARAAGIGFTVDPVTGDASRVVIEANWGLGEGVVAGSESIDCFTVAKKTDAIEKKEIGEKMRYVTFREKGAEWEDVPEDIRRVSCLSDSEIIAIAELGRMLEERMGCPQDFEWALDLHIKAPHNLFLLQTRPAKVVASPDTSDRIADLIAKKLYRVYPAAKD